jgi:hypothetical protein
VRRNTHKRDLRELERLSKLMSKYRHRWNPDGNSDRINSWIDAYESIRETDPIAWAEFCQAHGYAIDHDAYDCFA